MKRFLSMLLALVMMTGALVATPGGPTAAAVDAPKGYYGSRLTDPASIAFYQALETMDFASGGNLSVEDPAVIKLAETYAGGSDAMIRSFGAAVDSFRYDHTEYFYVDWDMLSVNVGRKNGSYIVTVGQGRTDSYLRDKMADRAGQKAAFDAALAGTVQSVQGRLPENATVRDIAKAANDVVCETVTYDFCDGADGKATDASKYIRTAYGALVNSRAVCEGYSRLYKAVLNELGVSCELVSGYYLNGESFEPHMWNYVQDEEGHWYAVDVTMNDSGTEVGRYFWQTEEFFSIDHIEDGKVSSVQYDMPYPELHSWKSSTESGRFAYGIREYEGQPAFWFNFDGKNADQLLNEDGLYMALRFATTNTGTLVWSPWQSVQNFNKFYNDMAPSSENETYFLGDNIAMPVLEVGVFDIPDDEPYGDNAYAYVYSEEAVRNHLIEKVGMKNPSHDPDYIAPAFVKRTEPTELFQRRQNILETQHIVLEYDMPLKVLDGKELEITWDVSSYNNRDLSLEAVQKNAKLENVQFDGQSTISFDFTPSRAYNHNMIFYNFKINNMVNVLDNGNDGVALRDFSIMYEYKDSIACCKIYNDGRLYVNSYAQPSIAMNGDLSTTGWTYTDTDGTVKNVSESQRSQMALVVTRPNNSDELVNAVTNNVGSANAIAQSTTYEIDLNICGKILQIPNGSYMKLNLGIPDTFKDLVGQEDIRFKLYHFKRNSTGELDYTNPEEIECVLTPYGIIAEVNSFSPYVLVAVKNSALPAEKQDTSKKIALVCNGHGGKVTRNTAGTLNQGETATYTLTPDAGYEVEYALLNGADVTINGNTISLAYDQLQSSNTLEVGFVAQSVKKAEADAGINNVSPSADCTVTFYSNGGSAVPAAHVKSGATVAQPTAPTKSGYRFDGWYTDQQCTSAYDFNSPVTASMTLYAKWTETGGTTPTPPEPPAWKNPFTDVAENAWYYSAVQYTAENKLFYGTSDTTFDPNGDMNRGMLATVIHRMAKKPETAAGNLFNDVADGKYYTEAIVWAAENKIIVGYGNNRFGPEDPVTREQIATILWRYEGSPKSTGSLSSFTDAGKTGDYAIAALQWAVEQKIVNGKGNGILDPTGKASRAEVAAMLMRYCQTVK